MSRKGNAAHRGQVPLSQHFLVDRAIAERIVARFDPRPEDAVIEIGPGRGALTELVAGRVRRLVAIELDRRLAAALVRRFGRRPGFELLVADATRVALASLGEAAGVRLLANLPYHISSPIVLGLLAEATELRDALLMFQAEFAARLAAAPGTRDYGSLTVLVRSRLAVTPVFDVPPAAFEPRPKVQSRVVELRPLERALVPPGRWPALQHLLRAAFSARRKTLANALAGALRRPRGEVEAALAAHGLDPRSRAEEHGPEVWAGLAGDERLAPAGTSGSI